MCVSYAGSRMKRPSVSLCDIYIYIMRPFPMHITQCQEINDTSSRACKEAQDVCDTSLMMIFGYVQDNATLWSN